ncbi:hypothetical protein Dsin_000824 [Dipteronia sinensis]|uniref:Reverse transcriptase zinc-binding domain-containing protein n=1 Tax=Dipteronia sinensis TaxID=43782 RepID=A0AAE0B2T5_9ROSI|nr:hypothetical protein Dsin_000824 [Dipteronia sinensis]
MSIFTLPISLCKDLTAMISKFWWGSRNGRRKISWVKWDQLCLPKRCGGLGFRDLALFNHALLANQAWRILKNPEDLAAQILRAKYFKGAGFLEAPTGSGCSHIWRSIIWGRSLLKDGLRWIVRDGNNIRVFKDQWLPRPSTFKPITPDPGSDLRVAELLDRNSSRWDSVKLHQLLLPIDRDIVRSIPVSWIGGHDSLSWHYDRKRCYSVKSGYRLALQRKLQDSASSSSSTQKWWSSLWCLNVPPKVRIFIWRVCLNAIPSLANLWARKVVADPCCLRCGVDVESGGHALFWCGGARKVWGLTRFDSFFEDLKNAPVLDVFQAILPKVSYAEFALFCMTTWAIWNDRNSFSNCGKSKESKLVASRAAELLSEFQNSMVALSPPTRSQTVISGSIDWLAPPPGLLKLNTEIATHKNYNSIGLGATIRDDKGKVIIARSRQL